MQALFSAGIPLQKIDELRSFFQKYGPHPLTGSSHFDIWWNSFLWRDFCRFSLLFADRAGIQRLGLDPTNVLATIHDEAAYNMKGVTTLAYLWCVHSDQRGFSCFRIQQKQ